MLPRLEREWTQEFQQRGNVKKEQITDEEYHKWNGKYTRGNQ